MGEDVSEEQQAPVFALTEKDLAILNMREEDYEPLTWDQTKHLISTNQLDQLTRYPSQLRAYLKWSTETKAEYGTMTNFILQNRVCWTDADPVSVAEGNPVFTSIRVNVPFADAEDYRILINDWPYGFSKDIIHVCVWLKMRLPVDDEIGDLTVLGRAMVDAFVRSTFEKRLNVQGQDKVMWFKNWAGLQSVRGLEHVHVLIRDVDINELEKIVDRPWEKS